LQLKLIENDEKQSSIGSYKTLRSMTASVHYTHNQKDFG